MMIVTLLAVSFAALTFAYGGPEVRMTSAPTAIALLLVLY